MVSLVCLEIHGLSQVFPLKWLFNGLPHHQFLLSYILSYHITIPISSYHIPYTCTITYIHLHLRLLTYLPERSHSQSHLRSNFANLPIFQTFHELFLPSPTTAPPSPRANRPASAVGSDCQEKSRTTSSASSSRKDRRSCTGGAPWPGPGTGWDRRTGRSMGGSPRGWI